MESLLGAVTALMSAVLKCSQQPVSPSNQLSSLRSPLHRHWRVTPLTDQKFSFILTLQLQVWATASQPPQGRLTFEAFIKMPLHSTAEEMLLFSVYSFLLERWGYWHTKANLSRVNCSFVHFYFSWKYSYSITFLLSILFDAKSDMDLWYDLYINAWSRSCH